MAKYKYVSLKKKYSGFSPTACKIDIDGFDVAEKFMIDFAEIHLTALYEAGYCKFHITDARDIKEENFTVASQVASKVKLGKPVKVSLGYGSELVEVFTGYIDSLETYFDNFTKMQTQVICLDAKGLMMNSCRSEIKTNLKKYTDAVSKTFDLYPDFITSKSITASDELTVPIHQHNESDYEFTVRIAKKLGYSFYMLGGKAMFKPYADGVSELIELTPSAAISRFSVRQCIRKRVSKVVVVNNDETDEKKQIKSEINKINSLEEQSTKNAKATLAMNDNMVKTISDPSATTPELAKKAAQAEIDRLSRFSVEGEIDLPGIPELVPAQMLVLNGFGNDVDKKYYITKIIHTINDVNFSTTVQISGNTL